MITDREGLSDECVCVVRVSTSSWHNDKGVYTKKSLNFLKRECVGVNFLIEDCGGMGAKAALDTIVNIDDVADGVYRVYRVYRVDSTRCSSFDTEIEYILTPYTKKNKGIGNDYR